MLVVSAVLFFGGVGTASIAGVEIFSTGAGAEYLPKITPNQLPQTAPTLKNLK